MTDLVRTDRALCPLRSIGQAEPVPCAENLEKSVPASVTSTSGDEAGSV